MLKQQVRGPFFYGLNADSKAVPLLPGRHAVASNLPVQIATAVQDSAATRRRSDLLGQPTSLRLHNAYLATGQDPNLAAPVRTAGTANTGCSAIRASSTCRTTRGLSAMGVPFTDLPARDQARRAIDIRRPGARDFAQPLRAVFRVGADIVHGRRSLEKPLARSRCVPWSEARRRASCSTPVVLEGASTVLVQTAERLRRSWDPTTHSRRSL
jgi:hypothetical protein